MQRRDQREPVAMSRYMRRGLLAAGLCLPLWAQAQATDPVPPTTNLVAVSGAPAPTEETFTIATAQDLTVTFTDFKMPAPLATATVVVTQGSALVGTATMSAPASSATLALPGAVGAYTLRVIGTPEFHERCRNIQRVRRADVESVGLHSERFPRGQHHRSSRRRRTRPCRRMPSP